MIKVVEYGGDIMGLPFPNLFTPSNSEFMAQREVFHGLPG